MKPIYFIESDFGLCFKGSILIRPSFLFVQNFFQRILVNTVYFGKLVFLPYGSIIIVPWGLFWIPSLFNILKLKKFTIISLTCDTFLGRKTVAGRYNGVVGRLKYFLAILTYKEPKFYIYCSRIVKEELLFFGVPEYKLIYKYQEWLRDSDRAIRFSTFTPNLDSNHILFIGHYYNMLQKRLDILIDAYIPIFDAGKFFGMKLTIVGGGWENFFGQEKIHYFATKNIIFEGYNYNIDEFIQDASFYVHPGEYEGFGVVVLEAMRAGLIPLISNLTGAIEIVHLMGSQFITSLTRQDFESKLIYLLSLSFEERKKYSLMSKEFSQTFTKENALKPLEISLKKIINGLY